MGRHIEIMLRFPQKYPTGRQQEWLMKKGGREWLINEKMKRSLQKTDIYRTRGKQGRERRKTKEKKKEKETENRKRKQE